MADNANTTSTDALIGAVVDLLKTGADPAILEAQRILLQRIALEGDVIVSRIPAPKNITEIGGYINLLTDLQQPVLEAQMLAGILGVAGPNPAPGWIEAQPLIAFVSIPNDRPGGAAQPAIPINITIRSDMLDAFQSARQALHNLGCMLPLLTPPRMLPLALPGMQPPDDVLSLLGRTLDVVPATALADPDNDALAVARFPSSPAGSFQLVARELDGATLVAENTWEVQKCDAISCTVLAAAPHRYQPLAPLLSLAGWYPPQTTALPTTLTNQGNLTRFFNVTGLVNGVTRLGDELSLLYPQSMIVTSSLTTRLTWVWNGTTFAAPS